MIKRFTKVITLLTIIFCLTFIGFAEEINEETTILENNEPIIIEITLEKAIETAMENNLEWRLTNKQLELEDLQVIISDRLNNDLRSAERDLRNAEEMLGDSILAIQDAISYVNSTTGGSGTIGAYWDSLNGHTVVRNYISKLLSQYGSETMVKGLDVSILISAMQSGSQQSAEQYFEIRTGKNQTITQANETATTLMGLKSVRKLTMKQALELIETSMEHGSRLIDKANEDAKRGFELQAENAFYEVVKKQKLLQVQNKAKQRAEEQYNNAQKSNEQGLLSHRELELALIQLNNIKASLHNAEIELKKANMDFCVALGLPLTKQFTIVEPEWSLVEITLEQGLEMAKNNRTDMVTSSQGLDMAELNLEYVDLKYKETTNQYKESVLYRDKKQLEYDNTALNAEVTITKAYYDWQNAEYAYQQINSNLDLVNNQLQIAEVSFEVGYSGKGESPLTSLLQAQEKVATLEEALTTAEFNRNLAWQKFLKEIGYVESTN